MPLYVRPPRCSYMRRLRPNFVTAAPARRVRSEGPHEGICRPEHPGKRGCLRGQITHGKQETDPTAGERAAASDEWRSMVMDGACRPGGQWATLPRQLISILPTPRWKEWHVNPGPDSRLAHWQGHWSQHFVTISYHNIDCRPPGIVTCVSHDIRKCPWDGDRSASSP
jgi:hypothetical protein